MNKFLSFLFIFALAYSPSALAESQCAIGKDDCAKCERGGQKDYGKEDCSSCPIAAKFFKKAKFFLSNKDEIGLTEDQVGQIKSLKADMKKNELRGAAEMKISMMEMEEKLSEPELDLEGINKMIDDGTAEWNQGAKAAVSAYAKLKAVLTPEQMTKAKAIWKKSKG